jgi:plasmid stabilization system protein ParE
MTRSFIIQPDAEADIEAARDWYEQQKPGLGTTFVAAIDSCFRRIQAMPGIYAVVARGVRLARIQRFPYVVLYRLTDDTIEVLAVMHTSRDPQTWQSRI